MVVGEYEDMDYSEFLRLRSAQAPRVGKWMRALAAADLQPMVPVCLPHPASENSTSTKKTVRKSADKLGIKNLDVIVLGKDVWVCILSAQDAEAGAK